MRFEYEKEGGAQGLSALPCDGRAVGPRPPLSCGDGRAARPSPPARKRLNHLPPPGVDVSSSFYFVTVCAAERSNDPFIPAVTQILDSVRFRQAAGIWFVSLFLVMPDHLHMLVHVPLQTPLADVIGNWKHYLARQHGLSFQRDFFETRIRDEAHYAEKWKYIVFNPVSRGLVETPREWPYVIAFDRTTGRERPHR